MAAAAASLYCYHCPLNSYRHTKISPFYALPYPPARHVVVAVRAFKRSDFDRFSKRVTSGKAWKDAWRVANDNFEQLVFDAKKTAERLDRPYSLSRNLDSAAQSAVDRARQLDREFEYRKQLGEFLDTSLGRRLVFDSRKNCVRYPRQNIEVLNSLIPRKKFHKRHYDVAQADQPWKLSRDVVARASMAQKGFPDSEYPLSEFNGWEKARGALFYTVTAVNAIFLFVLMVVGHPLVLLLDPYRRRFQHFVAKMWASLTIAPFFEVEYMGLENLPRSDVPAVYVSNHQSFLDIYTLLTLGRSFKFISKTSIFLYPIIGWAMFLLGVIPLKRMDSRSQLECLKRCMELIKGGASVFFFPEGTRSKDGKLGTFKKGAFSVATKTGVPVVPITLQGTGNIMPPGQEGLLNQGSVKVYIHPPLVGSNPEELCKEARKVISQKLSFED